MFKKLYDNLVVESGTKPLSVEVSSAGTIHVSAEDLLNSESAQRQLRAAKRISEKPPIKLPAKPKRKSA